MTYIIFHILQIMSVGINIAWILATKTKRAPMSRNSIHSQKYHFIKGQHTGYTGRIAPIPSLPTIHRSMRKAQHQLSSLANLKLWPQRNTVEIIWSCLINLWLLHICILFEKVRKIPIMTELIQVISSKIITHKSAGARPSFENLPSVLVPSQRLSKTLLALPCRIRCNTMISGHNISLSCITEDVYYQNDNMRHV